MKYRVRVNRTSFIFGTVEVEADCPSEAEKAVQEMVKDRSFHPEDEDEMPEDWGTEGVEPIEEEDYEPISIPEPEDGPEELDFG